MVERRHAREPGDVPADSRSSEVGFPVLDGRVALAWSAIWPGLIVMAAGVAGLGALLAMIDSDAGLARFDDPVLSWFFSHRSDAMTAVATPVTALFSSSLLPGIVLVLGFVWWWFTRRWREPLLFLGSMGLMLALSTVMKRMVDRPRPPGETMAVVGYETSGSFPSGHTIAAATFGLVGAYLVWTLVRTTRALLLWGGIGVFIIIVIACTRLYLGYHFLTDVLGGVSAAVVVLGVVMIVERVTPGIGAGPKGRAGSPGAGAGR